MKAGLGDCRKTSLPKKTGNSGFQKQEIDWGFNVITLLKIWGNRLQSSTLSLETISETIPWYCCICLARISSEIVFKVLLCLLGMIAAVGHRRRAVWRSRCLTSGRTAHQPLLVWHTAPTTRALQCHSAAPHIAPSHCMFHQSRFNQMQQCKSECSPVVPTSNDTGASFIAL